MGGGLMLDPHKYSPSVFDEDAKVIQWKNSIKNGVGIIEHPYTKRKKEWTNKKKKRKKGGGIGVHFIQKLTENGPQV